MNKQVFRLPESMSPQARNAFWSIIVLLVASGLNSIVTFRQASAIGAWQAWTEFGVVAMFFVILLISAFLNLRGRTQHAIGLMFGSFLVTIIARNALTEGQGVLFGLIVIAITSVLAFFNLPQKTANRLTIASIGIGGLIVLFDLVVPSYRQQSASLKSLPVVASLVVLVLLFLIFRQRAFLSGLLGNISFAWKMVLMVSVLFLGTLGVAGAGYSGLQSLRYQLSNIYDFMLIPIIAIDHADIALSEAQYLFENLNEVTSEELSKSVEVIQAGNKLADDTITRYKTEWVTTVSPEFTQALQEAGKLELQQQEIVAMESSRLAFDAYKAASEKYLATIQAGRPDDNLANDAIGKLRSARTNLQTLIDINNEYADFSNTLAQTAFRQALINGGIVLIIGLTLGFFMAYLIADSILRRLRDLTSSATAMQEGNLDQAVAVAGRDEVSLLGTTFNSMASQLKNLFGTLEQRVADRTRNLELAAEVGRTVSQVRDLNTMLRGATELIRSQFDLYYTQVYLTNPSQTELILQAGTGDVGEQLRRRGHRLPINTASINGRAVVEKRAVIISDTIASATFRPNPLLSETRSEMAVPLMIGDKVVGVLDMQSKNAGALNEESLSAFSALAGQLAVAISNANLLAATEEARAEVEAQAGRLTRANWKEYLDAINKAERVGFVYENNEIIPLVEDEIYLSSDGKTISSPIAISGETLGSMVVEMNLDNQAAHSAKLVNVVARQVAQQVENLRLLETAERYRLEAEGTTRRATIKGWKEYIEARGDASLGYLYDSNEVVPVGINEFKANEKSITLPLRAREETIGKLAIMGVEEQDTESLELATAVAERLSSHIESLRLFEETKRGQVELDKRARELESVAEISSVSARELDIHKMLETVVFLTQRRFGLYHAHVFTYNEFAKHLQIVACGWKEGDIHEGTHGTTTIALEQERSLVARAAREKRAVVVNDVQSDPGWLPNPLLPDTRSEMAVPLLVGDQLLGVLDVQKDYVNAFTDEDTAVVSTLATQVATALQNAHSFEQAQKQADRESMLNVISQKIQSATTVEAVLQIAARELGHALGAPLTIAQLGVKNGND